MKPKHKKNAGDYMKLSNLPSNVKHSIKVLLNYVLGDDESPEPTIVAYDDTEIREELKSLHLQIGGAGQSNNVSKWIGKPITIVVTEAHSPNEPLPNARIELTNPNHGVAVETVTDSEGKVTTFLAYGQYYGYVYAEDGRYMELADYFITVQDKYLEIRFDPN